MMMGLIINSEISKQFLLEEDAVQGFKKAVANNQQQLALKVLTEIIDTFMEAFDLLIETEDDSATEEEAVEPKVEEVKEEKKPAAKKADVKEEKVQTEEK
jgi:hypothetical protein